MIVGEKNQEILPMSLTALQLHPDGTKFLFI